MSQQKGTPPHPWMVNPVTPLDRYYVACWRFYIACRDGRPQDERDGLLAEAKRLEGAANA